MSDDMIAKTNDGGIVLTNKWLWAVLVVVVGGLILSATYALASLPGDVKANSTAIKVNSDRIERGQASMERSLDELKAELSEQRKLQIEILKEMKK